MVSDAMKRATPTSPARSRQRGARLAEPVSEKRKMRSPATDRKPRSGGPGHHRDQPGRGPEIDLQQIPQARSQRRRDHRRHQRPAARVCGNHGETGQRQWRTSLNGSTKDGHRRPSRHRSLSPRNCCWIGCNAGANPRSLHATSVSMAPAPSAIERLRSARQRFWHGTDGSSPSGHTSTMCTSGRSFGGP